MWKHLFVAEERSRGRRWRRWVAAALLLAVGYGVLNIGLVWRASTADDARPSDAIVVLGAAQYDGRPSPVLQARLDHALSLYESGLADVVVTTGSNQEGDRFTEGYAGFEYLLLRGVPEEDLLVVVDGTDTYEELAATANQLLPRGLDSVILVSDPYHARRVDEIADEVGLDAAVSPTDGSVSLRNLVRESGAVSIARVISYRRLSAWR